MNPQDPSAEEPLLTHLDAEGKAKMVDVSAKPKTKREAIAIGFIILQEKTKQLIQQGGLEKGDVFSVARIAGILAAKKTSELIPLCHPLLLTHIHIDFHWQENRLQVTGQARTEYLTGIEMEALTAVSIALLTIYDMCKAVDKDMMIEGVRLVYKTGGKSEYQHSSWKAESPQ